MKKGPFQFGRPLEAYSNLFVSTRNFSVKLCFIGSFELRSGIIVNANTKLCDESIFK